MSTGAVERRAPGSDLHKSHDTGPRLDMSHTKNVTAPPSHGSLSPLQFRQAFSAVACGRQPVANLCVDPEGVLPDRLPHLDAMVAIAHDDHPGALRSLRHRKVLEPRIISPMPEDRIICPKLHPHPSPTADCRRAGPEASAWRRRQWTLLHRSENRAPVRGNGRSPEEWCG